jgi:hypothetical protein
MLGYQNLTLLLNQVEDLDGPVPAALISELRATLAGCADQGRHPSCSDSALPAG